MKRKVLFPLLGKKEFTAGLKTFLLLLAVFLWSGNTFSQNWNQIIKTVAADRTSGVHLGSSVAISGDYAIVGAPQDGSGSAYIFQKSGANWIQMQKIVASDADSDDNFGTSVAISGDYVVVGAVYDNENAVNASPLADAGSAYVFKRTGATWAEEQKIVASDRRVADYFGASVAISGDYVVVGAFMQDLNASGASAISSAGAAYIFKRTLTTWAQEQKIVASSRNTDDGFGYAVAISGDYVVVGAFNQDQDAAEINPLVDAGSAYVFFRTGTSWAQQQKIVASDRGTFDSFGRSVSISGDYLVIGAPFEDQDAAGGNTAANAGSAYVFSRTGATWAQQQKIVASDRAANDNFAYSVSISGDYAIIGSLYEDENVSGTATLSSSGSAYVFSRSGTTWTQSNKIVASDRAADDNFGKSVAISGDYAIVGAPYEDEDAAGANTLGDAGSVYVFEKCGTVTGTTSVTNVSCNGGTNGAINLTPSGGVGGYTFSWGGGVTTEDRTGLTAGTYSVIITDANACVGTVSGITITQPTSISGSTVVTNVSCNGGTNGAINLTPSGGTGPYTFNWGGGVTTEDRTGLAAGTYAVIITDANACTRNVTGITVTQPPVLNGSTVVTNVSCNGGTTGAINLTPSGGTGPYTFNWGGGVTSEDRTGLAAATYAVIITDANACTRNVTGITVTQPTAAVSGTTVVTNVACFGGTNGAINLTPTGGTGPYTFNWGGGVTSEDRTGLTAGTYSVTITDANGCTGTVSPTVTQPAAAVSGTTVVTNVACFGGNTGAINLTATGGTVPYTFNWGGGVTSEDRTGLVAGTYSVTITDANGCTGTVSPTVTQPAATVSGTTVVTNVACFGGNTGAINLTATGGTGPYTFNWGGGITTEDRVLLAAGSYSVTITDANGCTGTVSPTVTQPAAAVSGTTVVTNVACFGGNTGAINLTATGGTGPYTFNWVGGITTEDRTGLVAGTYSVTITDANGCTGTISGISVTQSSDISFTAASQTNVACFGNATGAFEVNPALGGAGSFTYDWAPGTPAGDGTTSVTGLTAGTYSVTATDANSCTAMITFTITQPTALSVTPATQTNIACNGGSNGAAAINTPTGGTPGYTYDWAPGTPTGDGTTSITGITAGIYTVTVTDANGCTAAQSFAVTEPTPLSVTPATQTNIACNGGSTGAAAINTPTGGTPGYTYDWAPGTPTGDGTTSITGITAGTYTVTVTDANGCTAAQSFTVTEPTALSVTAATQTNIACNGGSNGAAAINPATDGTPGYTYDWAPGTPTGDGTTSVTGLTAGTYTVTVTDANGCTASQAFTVTQPTAISVTQDSQTNIACNGGATGAVEINPATGGAGSFTYDWAPGTPTGDGTTSVTGLTAGTYTVTVTDANGCTDSQAFTVTEPTAISVTPASQTNIACNGGANGAAEINPATGGASDYSYDWAPGTPSGEGTTSVAGLVAGTYTVTATDNNGCTATQTFTITEPAAISVSVDSQTDVSCNNGSNGAVAINTPTGGTPGYTYDWAPGNPTGDGTTSVTGLTAGTYTVTVTDANGCTAEQLFTITEPAAITSSFTATSCDSYTWNTQTYATSGTYTQVLTSVSGCDSTVTLNLTINMSSSETLNVTECESYTLNGQTYTASGTYTQTLTNAAACDSIITLNLIINSGDADTISVTACDSYVWNGQTFTTSGFYSASFTNANGCDSIENLDLTIVTTPTAGITSLDAITLQATGTGTYQWINCSGQIIVGETNANFTATSNGSYAVIVSNGSCSDTSNCVVISQVGLDENSSLFGVTLTPNPTQNDVKITFTGTKEASIVIYDAKGKIVMSVDHAQTGEVLSVEAFERGVYLVNILTTSGNHTERLVKQ